jgi:hypothetical protein
MVYMGNATSGTSAGTAFSMDLSTVGSSFTMTMGYAPNPAVTGIRDQPPNVSDVGSLLMKMGVVQTSTGSVTMGSAPSLFISFHEITSVSTALPGTLGSTTGYYEVRTTNATSAGTSFTGTNTVTLQAMNTADDYNYYVYETTYTNSGFQAGEALFDIVVEVQAYSINRTSFAVSPLGSVATYTINDYDTNLTASQLTGLRPALGYSFPNVGAVSVTGSTYDYFSTDIGAIPEPTAAAMVSLAAIYLLPRRRKARASAPVLTV